MCAFFRLERAILDTHKIEKPTCVHIWEVAGHGRIETRTCKTYSNLSYEENIDEWKELKTIFIVESEVYKKSTGLTAIETRSYITSHIPDASLLNRKTRSHWAIENNLHWTLDFTFGEDASRKRKGHSPENFNIILKTALTLLANDSTPKLSKNRKRLQAALNPEYRENY